MKKISIIAMILLTVASTALAEVDGFRGVKWGTDISDFKKNREVDSMGWNPDPNTEMYMVKDDKLKIGTSNLEGIIYTFWKGKFSKVMIVARGFQNFQDLKRASFEKFGKGYQRNIYINNYTFGPGKITGISLDYNTIESKSSLYMFSKRLFNQANIEKSAKAKQGAKNDF